MQERRTPNWFLLRPATIVAGMLSALCLTGCVGTVSRVHIDDEPINDVEASDVDIRAMSREMATAIIELPIVANAKESVHIAFLNIENRTLTTDFDSYNLLSKIRQQLIEHSKGKLVFLEKEQIAAFLEERDAKRAGQVTTKGHKDIPGVDYLLTGYAYSMRKTGAGGKILAAHRYSFRLSDAETTAVIWEKDYEFKKLGQRGIAYR
jgi:PBP1b-binding outer membrane lipoprotein LpoB